jgi:hypothetical protein
MPSYVSDAYRSEFTMKHFAILPLLSASLLTVHCVAARGETFVLKNGGKVEGEWLNADQEPQAVYRIKTASGGQLTLSSDIVEEVIAKSELMRRYEEFLAEVPDTAEGHWDLAQRCQKAGLKTQREFHLRKVLQFDPNHEDARHALGYSRVKGEWVIAEQWLERHGFIRHKGDWRLAQEIELERKQEQREEEERAWRTKLRRWHSSIVRGRGEPDVALAEIQKINDIRAVPALAQLLASEDTPRRLALIYIDVISRFNSSLGASALTDRLLTDADLETRERCVDGLLKHGRQQAIQVLTKTLHDKKNFMVNRAAWALGQLGAEQVLPELIEALTTSHRFMVGGGGNMNVGFGQSGVEGLSAGGGPQLVQQDLRNEEVLNALIALTPDGVNFRYNKTAWKNWLAQTRIPPTVNLRRDD